MAAMGDGYNTSFRSQSRRVRSCSSGNVGSSCSRTAVVGGGRSKSILLQELLLGSQKLLHVQSFQSEQVATATIARGGLQRGGGETSSGRECRGDFGCVAFVLGSRAH